MVKIMAIFGVRVGSNGPPQYFSAPEDCKIGDYVLVPMDPGSIMGKIVSGPMRALPGANSEELPSIIRVASSEDMREHAANETVRKQAFDFCKERIKERKLEMKLVDVDIHFDKSKYIFYFTAPGRIDFRELVKDLVKEYRARIELRQIGVRHETQRIGAIGNCGQVCCCRRFLKKFAPVTIKMAKEQNLFLNPSKISGICGRLLCCLAHEQENYEEFHHRAPGIGKKYQTRRGILKVINSNMFKESISVLTENNEELELSMAEWKNLAPVKIAQDESNNENECEDENFQYEDED